MKNFSIFYLVIVLSCHSFSQNLVFNTKDDFKDTRFCKVYQCGIQKRETLNVNDGNTLEIINIKGNNIDSKIAITRTKGKIVWVNIYAHPGSFSNGLQKEEAKFIKEVIKYYSGIEIDNSDLNIKDKYYYDGKPRKTIDEFKSNGGYAFVYSDFIQYFSQKNNGRIFFGITTDDLLWYPIEPGQNDDLLQ